jgi:hypothetical protein
MPHDAVELAGLAGQQCGAFYASLKAFGVPDNQAEFLTRAWLEARADEQAA